MICLFPFQPFTNPAEGVFMYDSEDSLSSEDESDEEFDDGFNSS